MVICTNCTLSCFMLLLAWTKQSSRCTLRVYLFANGKLVCFVMGFGVQIWWANNIIDDLMLARALSAWFEATASVSGHDVTGGRGATNNQINLYFTITTLVSCENISSLACSNERSRIQTPGLCPQVNAWIISKFSFSYFRFLSIRSINAKLLCNSCVEVVLLTLDEQIQMAQ